MSLIRALLRVLGLAPSDRDREIMQLVKGSYKSVQVVGRGTIKIDPQEVLETPEFQHALKLAKEIVDSQRRS